MVIGVEPEVEDTALGLWKEWFEYSGIPWERDVDNWDSSCFFCGEGHPEHKWNCVFVRACRIVIPQDKEK